MTECVNCDHDLDKEWGLCINSECTCTCFDYEENWN